MMFVLKPSLEHMTLVKIGISLWNQNGVSASISKLRYMDLYPSEWEKIEEKVTEKVPLLSLPQPLKEKVFGVIKPIGIQIFEWMKYYNRYIWMALHRTCHPAHLQAELCWTPLGTVDRKRTAEVLVRDENLDVSTRYILACDNCLEDEIIRIWKSLPEYLKYYDWHNCPVISFWSDNMKRAGAGHISYKDIFYSSVRDSNKVAAKYFLQKITPQEREECLEEFAKYIDDADVLCFLLPEMEKEQQILVFKSNPCGVLQCFLQWPFQSLFMEIANCMWDFLSRHNYPKILGDIIGKVRDGYKDYNYQKLFGEFWQKSPRALKDSIIENIDRYSSLLYCLFDIKDKEIIRIILKDVSLTAKSKLIYSGNSDYYLKLSIRDNEWDFLQFFIRECLPLKNEMLKFKEEFEKRIFPYFKEHFATKKLEWDQLFSLSEDSICEYNK